MTSADYVTRVFSSPLDIPAEAWNQLLAREADPSPFMDHAYLVALHVSGCAQHPAGWQARFVTLWQGADLHAACPLYLKNHSYGEYVFDWAWANAYAQHGLDYYPKALVAVPFTPVPGARLLAKDPAARKALVHALLTHTREEHLSSLHLLFAQPQDVVACEAAGMMLRYTVQFHWKNVAPTPPNLCGSPSSEGAGMTGAEPQCFQNFDHFLVSLQQEKRKKIRQERRKVAEAGVVFRWSLGTAISVADWDFFYRCYERTYREHGNAPYLNRDFFQRMAQNMSEHWLLFIAERDGQPIASSLIGIDTQARVAYGRYWGALERVDCLHFEACYYQPLAWCIAQGYRRFEGGAQGEHKMARALLPVKTTSAHWLAHPSFANAVERFLEREDQGLQQYLDHLAQRNPIKNAPPPQRPPSPHTIA
ncbi:MAG: GNAT family N-acetyltransferase [Hydrogenophaga sp.]|uniref:GNAT family N-acetyltransferase n=1 Tax=Hydrogenophaga sp. TaxID=1904254 RepID=UPI00276F5F52|nr:GNAT family N-acetyltransferase [Hydrogenophaga sp.]MDP2418586.1 GNAT family N-acetyltransferase [Hydrogenophaga sp.]MDZ4189745.1 GNAT family N-acetyltransferase [Hydrogenophaga sp.]